MPERIVNVHTEGLAQLRSMLTPDAWWRGLNEGLTDAAIDIAARGKDNAPVKTSRLRATIKPWGRMSGPRRVIVAGGAGVRYAKAHETGSGLHGPNRRRYPIRPRKAKWLRFPSQEMLTQRRGSRARLKTRLSGKVSSRSQRRYGNDAYVFKKLVMHPGVRAKHYMRRALFDSPVPTLLAKALVNEWKRRGAK